MSYIAVLMNHLRANKAWADAHDAQAQLNVRDFSLEIKGLNRYFRLRPQFLMMVEGKLVYTAEFGEQVTGFTGWLPYSPVRRELSGNKLAFKRFLREVGVPTPAFWPQPQHANAAYVLKDSGGSFGYGMRGPYGPGPQVNGDSASSTVLPASRFAEAFVQGQNLKVWFWGATAFHAHLEGYPTVQGDGARPLGHLIRQRIAESGAKLQAGDEETMADCLAFQGHPSQDEVLAAGESAWLDYRYGRRYKPDPFSTVSDSMLEDLSTHARLQVDQFGRLMDQRLQMEFPAPVLYSADAVLDAQGTLWWLEMNSNPILPPTGYPHVLATLFGTPVPGESVTVQEKAA